MEQSVGPIVHESIRRQTRQVRRLRDSRGTFTVRVVEWGARAFCVE